MQAIFHALLKRKLLVLSLLANVFLLLFCFHLFSSAKKTYSDYRHFRALEIGTSKATTTDPSAINSDNMVVLYGDSRIETWYPNPEVNNFTFINAGISGETTMEMRRRFETDVLRLKPKYVLIQAGMNDLTTSVTKNVPNPEQHIERMHDNMRYFISTLESQGIEVIVTSIIPSQPLGLTRKIFWHNTLDDKVKSANTKLKEATLSLGAHWFDLDPHYYDSDGNLLTDLYYDTLHINYSGYDVLNLQLGVYLNTLAAKNN